MYDTFKPVLSITSGSVTMGIQPKIDHALLIHILCESSSTLEFWSFRVFSDCDFVSFSNDGSLFELSNVIPNSTYCHIFSISSLLTSGHCMVQFSNYDAQDTSSVRRLYTMSGSTSSYISVGARDFLLPTSNQYCMLVFKPSPLDKDILVDMRLTGTVLSNDIIFGDFFNNSRTETGFISRNLEGESFIHPSVCSSVPIYITSLRYSTITISHSQCYIHRFNMAIVVQSINDGCEIHFYEYNVSMPSFIDSQSILVVQNSSITMGVRPKNGFGLLMNFVCSSESTFIIYCVRTLAECDYLSFSNGGSLFELRNVISGKRYCHVVATYTTSVTHTVTVTFPLYGTNYPATRRRYYTNSAQDSSFSSSTFSQSNTFSN
jgi:hypothetical protein